jgi:signal transduction histidine kinase
MRYPVNLKRKSSTGVDKSDGRSDPEDIDASDQSLDSPSVYKSVVEQIPIGISIWEINDADDVGSIRYLYRNLAAHQATNATLHRVIGATIRESFPRLIETELPATIAEVARSGQPMELGEFHYGDGGVPGAVYSIKVFPLDGQHVGMSFENITDVKKAEKTREDALTALEAANQEESLRLAHEQSALAEIGRIITSSPKIDDVYENFAERVRGLIPFDRILIAKIDPGDTTFTFQYALGMDVLGIRRGDTLLLAGSLTEVVRRTGEKLAFAVNSPSEVDGLAKRFPTLAPALRAGLQSQLSLPLRSQGEVIGALYLQSREIGVYLDRHLDLADSIATQISGAVANAILLVQLEANNVRLAHLNQEVVAAQENERKRISRELHDEAGQALIALKISLQFIEAGLPLELELLHKRVTEAITVTDSTMEEIRILARGLRPPALDAVGLSDALSGLCFEFAKTAGIPIDYSGDDIPLLSDMMNICLYRVLQEALANTAKHANASKIAVILNSGPDWVELSVVDDGDGFVVLDDSLGAVESGGIGLLGMKERIEGVGGRLLIEAHLEEGTRLSARVPVEEPL